MAKPRKNIKAAPAANEPIGLAEAIKFVEPAHDEKSPHPAHRHARLQGGFIVATDGIVSIGTPIKENISVAPHIGKLTQALSRCKSTLTLAQQANDTLLVRSGGFRATVPCVPMQDMYPILPDAKIAAITPSVIDALRAVSPLAAERDHKLAYASVLLQGGSAVATNGFCLAEYWHGVDLPPGLLLPKASVQKLLKCNVAFTGFGFSANSVTFHADNGAFFKSQLYVEKYLDYARIFHNDMQLEPVPEGLADAAKALLGFHEQDHIDIVGSMLSVPGGEASYIVDGLNASLKVNGKDFAAMLANATQWDYTSAINAICYFVGTNFRSAITVRR